MSPRLIGTAGGWLRDPMDFRDFTIGRKLPCPLARAFRRLRHKTKEVCSLPKIDLREQIEGTGWDATDQKSLNTSTVFAVLDAFEYFERLMFDRTVAGSHLFLYAMARKLRGMQGDCGADLRTTLKAVVRFGVPPERFWPYENRLVNVEPRDPFLFSFAREYQDLHYLRLDAPTNQGETTLASVRSFLAAGFVVLFGFPLPNRIPADGTIPFRPDLHDIVGGLTALAIGYDDNRRCATEKGAILFRSSWGMEWGEHGCGWLPYRYLLERIAADFWAVVHCAWLDRGTATDTLTYPSCLGPSG